MASLSFCFPSWRVLAAFLWLGFHLPGVAADAPAVTPVEPTAETPAKAAAQTPAEPEYTLAVSPDHPDAVYKKGEEVTFTVRATRHKEPLSGASVEWRVSKDGVAPFQKGTAQLENGEATVKAHLGEAGFLQCQVTFQPEGEGAKKITELSGVAIDPLEIWPSLPVPEDFDEFWTARKEALAAVPVNARLTPVKSTVPELEAFDLQADSVGAPVSGYYVRPKGAEPGSLPAILTVHGAGVRPATLTTAAGWAKEKMLALDINAHGLPNGEPKAFYEEKRKGELKNYQFSGRESRDTIYFQGMFLRLVRAIDFLTSQPEWDGKTVIVYGSSQGGAQAIAAAGLDPRVSFFVAGVPALCDVTGAAAERIAGWPKIVPVVKGKPDPTVLEAARYYDGVNFVSRTKAPGFFTVGFIDTTCPPTSVYAAYNHLASEKEIYNDIPSGHTNSKEAVQKMREAVLKHVATQKGAAQ